MGAALKKGKKKKRHQRDLERRAVCPTGDEGWHLRWNVEREGDYVCKGPGLRKQKTKPHIEGSYVWTKLDKRKGTVRGGGEVAKSEKG